MTVIVKNTLDRIEKNQKKETLFRAVASISGMLGLAALSLLSALAFAGIIPMFTILLTSISLFIVVAFANLAAENTAHDVAIDKLMSAPIKAESKPTSGTK